MGYLLMLKAEIRSTRLNHCGLAGLPGLLSAQPKQPKSKQKNKPNPKKTILKSNLGDAPGHLETPQNEVMIASAGWNGDGGRASRMAVAVI